MIRLRDSLEIGLDLDDTIFGFSEGYLKRFKHFPKYDWAITRNVEHILRSHAFTIILGSVQDIVYMMQINRKQKI